MIMFTVGQAAAVLGIGRSTMYRRIADGEIPAVNVAAREAKRPKLRVVDTALNEYATANTVAS